MATSHGTELLFKGLTRADEYQADKTGIGYANDAGYDAGGLVSFLEVLKDTAESDAPEGVSLLFATHPDIDNRISRAETVLSAKGYTDDGGRVLADRFSRYMIPASTPGTRSWKSTPRSWATV